MGVRTVMFFSLFCDEQGEQGGIFFGLIQFISVSLYIFNQLS